MNYTPCIRINKRFGTAAIQILKSWDIYSSDKKIKVENVFLNIPLKRKLSQKEFNFLKERFSDIEECFDLFEVKASRHKNLREVLKDKLSPEELKFVHRSFDVIGDLAIIDVPPNIEHLKQLIGESLISINPSIKGVFIRKSKTSGTFRIREVEHIAGCKCTITYHRQYNTILKVDISNVYFNPKLSSEYKRVADKIKPNERVLDMFCGIGPFSILISKQVKSMILSIDLNPCAIKLLKENIHLNKTKGLVLPLHSDSGLILSADSFKNYFDRVIMNLPGQSLDYLNVACKVVKQFGFIHCYFFVNGRNPISDGLNILHKHLNDLHINSYHVSSSRVVREVAPFKWIVVFDIQLL